MATNSAPASRRPWPEIPHLDRVPHELSLQYPAPPKESRLRGPLGNLENLSDLRVAEPVHVAQNDGRAVVLGERVDRAGDLLVDERVVKMTLRIVFADDLERRPAGVVLQGNFAALDPASAVDEQVIQDGEQPGTDVRAELVLFPALERAQHGVGHEILGVMPRACQLERKPVHTIEMRQRLAFEPSASLGLLHRVHERSPCLSKPRPTNGTSSSVLEVKRYCGSHPRDNS